MKNYQIMKQIKFVFWSISSSLVVWLSSHLGLAVMALPPINDTPEEILRTEIIIDARSPIDGKLLTPVEYAQLQEKLQVSPPPKLSQNLRQTVFLLRLRKVLLQVFPFLDL
ncbi:hypothetical protein L6494_13380 [Nostoc sp. UHCC 0870]|uniref:hypothetical protein n=2 Tax=Nostoc sp. UHCC 0870 TaxID=2914041 RepID=UPI001EDDA7DE|nr:hypothetical protein [Nostoc sp. UHCC 0870]UKP00629.1 hypothetical protein L6494_13380 [Nostoc sp. UHCC 0870]